MFNSSQKKIVRFCSYCGANLGMGARFCKHCGEAIVNPATDKTSDGTTNTENPNSENPTERKTVYEGEIHKCPNCGEILNAFVTTCPICGYELRGTKSPDSINQLSKKLEYAKDESVKINLIRTFPVPNTREDILEFLILASTNIENSCHTDLSEAWSVKFEQAYEKSKILYGDAPEFTHCYQLFLTKKIKNEKEKQRSLRKKERITRHERASAFFDKNHLWLIYIALFLGFVVLFFLVFGQHATKLEKLVDEVEECIDNGDFEEARRKASQIIDDSGWSDESKAKWDAVRESLLEAIERQEVISGSKVYVRKSSKDLKGKNFTEVIAYLEKRGFTNIQTEIIADLILGWLKSDGEVEKVEINGSSDFNENSAFTKDSEIIVYYHTYDK